DLLRWLDQAGVFRSGRDENEWQAFVEVCKSQLAFDPQNDGGLAGAGKLADHVGPWQAVWERFCEAPKRYPGIPDRIRKCKTPVFDLFADAESAGGWPQWNEEQEAGLLRDLQAIGKAPSHEGRKKLPAFEKKHGERRALVWAELGEAPLAQALEHLAVLAEITTNGLAAGTIEDMVVGYRSNGWRADDAVIRALSCVAKPAELKAVTTAVRSVYLPWAEESARHLQKIWNREGEQIQASADGLDVDCVLFVDGLRFDCAKRLVQLLEETGCEVQENERWAALPSVTGTGKPAVAPICHADCIAEEPEPGAFDVLSGYQFDKALKENGWLIVRPKDAIPAPVTASPAKYPKLSAVNKLWVEFGDIDHAGHDRGWKLARHMDVLLAEIRDRITALLAAGWERVRVVTDHGWLLLPGGLPKTDLPSALTESKWGRCALLKPGAKAEGRLYPWFWNPNQSFALADGVSCFKKGEDYAHGGLSLQECLTLQLTVACGSDGGEYASVVFSDVVWKGLRCTVAIEGDCSELSFDVRTQPGNPASSVVVGKKAKPLKSNGTASVVVENEDLEGEGATLVLLDATGGLIAQVTAFIGGDDV
ncbi:MAG: BREX-1 system phosphatase PglZ type B, partial [Lentisphaeria bacterium]|nr:BREX-1 system phosphatase PglZ type B [Lentisphaeria bacterium]